MAKAKRDWFAVPSDGYYIVDTRVTKVGIHDASKPYAVMERYYSGYRSGMSTGYHGRYADLDAAKRRVRYLESGS